MNRLVTLLAIAGSLAFPFGQQVGTLGALLHPGMQLVYSSDGTESPPWSIDSVAHDVTVDDRTGCVRIRLRINPTQAAPDTRFHCVEAMTMFNWDARANVARPARPLGAGATLDIPASNGGRARYETGQPIVEWIRVKRREWSDSSALEVIPTTVTTFDSTGRAVRRLRERFSIGLATATGGVFEVADSTQPSGWRANRTFALVAIRLP